MTDDPVVEARPLTCAACRRRIWWVVDGLNPNGVWLDEHRVHIWIDGHAHAPTMIEAIPPGVFDGANRYDTDDEHVLSLWARGETVDIRIPRLDTARDAVPDLATVLADTLHAFGYDVPADRGKRIAESVMERLDLTARDAVPEPSLREAALAFIRAADASPNWKGNDAMVRAVGRLRAALTDPSKRDSSHD